MRYLLTHRAVVTAALTAVLVLLAALGVLPAVPHIGEILGAVGAALTAIFGLQAEEEAYVDGLLDQLEDALNGE
jgi:hypothetical protein